jgi:sarcosine oxidase subunit alpha
MRSIFPATRSNPCWKALWSHALGAFGAVPYGIEALEILRTEKGFIHIGTDTDGTTLPADIGFAKCTGS